MAGITTYSQEIADAICESIADGISLRDICKRDDMPSRSTVFKWLNDVEGFSNQYARAREEQAETLADDIIAIADDGFNDTYIDENTGEKRTIADVIARSRLRVDARKWVASKLKPKKYGDKLDVDANHTGSIVFTLSNDDANL